MASGSHLRTHFSTLRVHARPARSIFSNALNFCHSAIAALVRSPWLYLPIPFARRATATACAAVT